MKTQYNEDFRERMRGVVSALDTALTAYEHIKTTRDVSFKVQFVSTLAGVVATILLFTPAAPAGIIIGQVKLAVDVVNTAATLGVMYYLKQKLQTALTSHDSLQQNIRFTQFREDYQIAEYYLKAQDLHGAKINDLKTTTSKVLPQIFTATVQVAQAGTLIGFRVKSGLKPGLYKAVRWPAGSCILDELYKPQNLFALAHAVTAVLDLINLWQTNKNKNLDFNVYNLHISELQKTKESYKKLILWCTENLTEEQIQKLDKEFAESLREIAKDEGIEKAEDILREMRASKPPQ